MTKNLDKSDKISFTEYIPAEFYRRHREINSIAKILRNNDLKTHVRIGKYDYKLLSKDKDDTTEWSKVTPYNLTDDIAKFEIGIVPQTNINKRRRDNDTDDNYTYDIEETRSQHVYIEETSSQIANNVENIIDNIVENIPMITESKTITPALSYLSDTDILSDNDNDEK